MALQLYRNGFRMKVCGEGYGRGREGRGGEGVGRNETGVGGGMKASMTYRCRRLY